MATVTRVNGSSTRVGILFTPNCNAYIITVKIANATAVDLQTEDSYVDANTSLIGGVIEAIVSEINPLAWFVPAASSGVMHVIMDKSINDATELRTRIRNIGKPAGSSVTAVGPNAIDISGTTVVAASSITVA
jgi:hypothetical protein